MSNIRKSVLSLFTLMFIVPAAVKPILAEEKAKIIKTKVAKPTNKPCTYNNISNPSEDSFGFKLAVGYETTRPIRGGTFTGINKYFAKLSPDIVSGVTTKASAEGDLQGHSIVLMKDEASMKYPGSSSSMINQVSDDGKSNKLQLHKGGAIFGDISTGYEFSFGDTSLDTEISIGMKGATTHNSVIEVETKPEDRKIMTLATVEGQSKFKYTENDIDDSEFATFQREVKVDKSFRFGISSELKYSLFDSNQISVRLDGKLEMIPKNNISVKFSHAKGHESQSLAYGTVLPIFDRVISVTEPFKNTSSAWVGGLGVTTSAGASLAGIQVGAFVSARYDVSLNDIKLSRKVSSVPLGKVETQGANQFYFTSIHDANAEQQIKDLQIKGWVFGAGIKFTYRI